MTCEVALPEGAFARIGPADHLNLHVVDLLVSDGLDLRTEREPFMKGALVVVGSPEAGKAFCQVVTTPEFIALRTLKRGYAPKVVGCDWDEETRRRVEAAGWRRVADRERENADRSERVAEKERRTPKYPHDPGLPDFILGQSDASRARSIMAKTWADVLQGDLPNFIIDEADSLITGVTSRELALIR